MSSSDQSKYIGVPCIVLAILWQTSGKGVAGPPAGVTPPPAKITLGKALGHVIRIRAVWILGIVALCSFGAAMAMVGYLP